MRYHRSSAYVKAINQRLPYRKPEPITSQFRFVVRMAAACHDKRIPYDLAWNLEDSVMRATITVTGKAPEAKQLPRPPKLKLVAAWKPALWDAEYRLEAWHDSSTKRMRPGFVIEHSSGLSLVHPSESDMLGGDDEDIRQKWFLTHTASGLGFGLTLTFKRATDALLLAASFPVDWTRGSDALRHDPAFRRAGYSVQAAFLKGWERDSAKRHLKDMDRAEKVAA